MKKMFTREYSKYLYQSKDKEVYLLRPTKKQWDDIKQYIMNSLQKDKEGGYEINEKKSVVFIKLIYDILSSQKEETSPMSLDEFFNAINKVVFELRIKQAVTLYRKVEDLIKDICEEIKYEALQGLQAVNDYSDTIDLIIDKQQVDKKVKDLTEKLEETKKLEENKKINLEEQNKNNEEIVNETNNNQIED